MQEMLDKVHAVIDKLSGRDVTSLNCIQKVSEGKRAQCDAVLLGSVNAKIRANSGSGVIQTSASEVSTSVNAQWRIIDSMDCSTMGPPSTFVVQELQQQVKQLSAEVSRLKANGYSSQCTEMEKVVTNILAKTGKLPVEDNISHAACNPVPALRVSINDVIKNRPRITTPGHTIYMNQQRAKTGLSNSKNNLSAEDWGFFVVRAFSH